jgi:ABC-type lipoprotein export system ATPase subunit
MVVGQSGSGKTTLLNSLVNYHMGLQFQDPFRYIIVREDLGRDKEMSQTTDVI